ncbi:50S ribosomal protein L21 [Stratiformator vulcanicus]|uniref:Large ribosomal subunit protein bL21 n=1 Tax=Stratiformator vulcanicus TaxID=2527980 RepID=A0A517R4B2_9PLAN|nr:50S ribosomal protein L21 [Stratiformator vulcanicus]QDT38663.1 50S ribosomal protein L21 [Stratiformator vulcanicus]
MFAIIEDGSRQYRVEPGRRFSIDYRDGSEEGGTITFDKVMLANGGAASVIGQPLIEGATVVGEIVRPEEKGEKLEIQKLRRRKNSRRHTGHRQKYTLVSISEINVPGLEVVEPDDEEQAPEPSATATEEADAEE